MVMEHEKWDVEDKDDQRMEDMTKLIMVVIESNINDNCEEKYVQNNNHNDFHYKKYIKFITNDNKNNNDL